MSWPQFHQTFGVIRKCTGSHCVLFCFLHSVSLTKLLPTLPVTTSRKYAQFFATYSIYQNESAKSMVAKAANVGKIDRRCVKTRENVCLKSVCVCV